MIGTFVSIGSSPRHFSRLLDEIKQIAPHLPQPVVVQHGRTPFEHETIRHFAFANEAEFLSLLSECRLFITHGGGGSVLSAIRMGKTPVLVPRLAEYGEVVDNHQIALAKEVAKQDQAVVVDDLTELLDASRKALEHPVREASEGHNRQAIEAITDAIAEFAPDPDDCIALITPSGGHLTEIRQLAPTYRDKPHFFVVNMPLVEPPEMQGRTVVITLSERDWKFLFNLWEAFIILRKRRPKVILTTGGAFSVAFTFIGKFFGVKTIYVETIGKVVKPTLTGRFMYRLANRFFYQWPHLASHFPRGEYIGLIL